MRSPLASLPLLLVLAAAGASPGQGLDAAVPLTDLLEIEIIDRQLVALDANGGQVSERLHLNERVVWRDSRGRVGVVITNERVLAVATGSASWQERRYEVTETPPESALLGDRVALLVTSKRAIGFSAAGRIIEHPLGPREQVQSVGVGENVGVVLTDRQALGLSPHASSFAAKNLQIHERIERLETKSALATVRTSRRLLVFRSPTAAWSEQRRGLGG